MHQMNSPHDAVASSPSFGAPALVRQSYVDVERMLLDVRPSPLRYLIEAIIGNNHSSNLSHAPLFTALAATPSPRWKERVLAAWALGRVSLNNDERDAAETMLLEAFTPDEEDTAWDRVLRGLSWAYGLMFPVSLAGAILLSAMGSRAEWGGSFFNLLVILGSFTGVFTVPYCFWRGHEESVQDNCLRAAAAESLGMLRIVGSVGTLARGVFDENELVQEAATSALMELLPMLKEDHRSELSESALQNLGELLSHPNSLLAIRALEALAKVGTGKQIPYVEHVAQYGGGQGLKAKALATLEVLESRRRNEIDSRNLVRSANAPVSESDQLLRGVMGRTGSFNSEPVQQQTIKLGE